MIRVFHNIRRHWLLLSVVVGVVVYAIIFASLYWGSATVFKDSTSIMKTPVGNMTAKDATQAINASLAATPVLITANNTTLKKSVAELGVSVTPESVAKSVAAQRLRFALFPLQYPKTYAAELTINNVVLAHALQEIQLPPGTQAPTDAFFALASNNSVTITPSKDGIGIPPNDIARTITEQVIGGSQSVTIATQLATVQPLVTTDALNEHITAAQTIAHKTYTLNAQGKEVLLPLDSILNALAVNQQNKLALPSTAADGIIASATDSLKQPPVDAIAQTFASNAPSIAIQPGVEGKNPSNNQQLSGELVDAISNQSDYKGTVLFANIPFVSKSISINDNAKRVVTYSLTAWGVTKASMSEFRYNAAQTLNSNLGWSRADLAFKEVTSNPDFWLVLAEPKELSARYPTICSSFYSCRVNNYVMINDERWRTSTPPWTLSIRDYQHLVINHETGHWLGLKDNNNCPGAGQPALVMQQQSIDLGGCSFNPWPTVQEIERLKTI